jgi:hypothetical protein
MYEPLRAGVAGAAWGGGRGRGRRGGMLERVLERCNVSDVEGLSGVCADVRRRDLAIAGQQTYADVC